MTDYQKGTLVMDYLESLNVSWVNILDAVCDEKLEQSYQIIKDNPKISKAKFFEMTQIEEEAD